jgi:murein hydrolase activator
MRARAALTLLLALALTTPAIAQLDLPGATTLDGEVAAALSALEDAEAERGRLDMELAGLTAARAASNRRVRDHTRALYRITRAGSLPIAGGFSALLGHLARVERLERMVEHDVRSLEEIETRAEGLADESGLVAARAEAARARVGELESRRRETELAAVEAALGASSFSGVITSLPGGSIRIVDSAPSDPAATFEGLRGTLALPLAAPTRVADVTEEGGASLSFFGARSAPVRCAGAGRVAYAGRHSELGRLVIVDHGGSYFTLYGRLGAIDAAVGTELGRGATIGTIDDDPLLFQIRRGTRALEPRGWLGL